MSTDPVSTNATFAQTYGFPFLLLSDPDRTVCMAYGPCGKATDSARRITYIIGPDGHVAHVFPQVNPVWHVAEVLAALDGRDAAQLPPPPAPRERGGLIYALGELGYDFGTPARRDAFASAMAGPQPTPGDPMQFLAYLQLHPEHAAGVFWTLMLDQTPIYVIQPRGAFAAAIYQLLPQLLQSQLDGQAERLSLPGVLTGHRARLQSGQVVPVVAPDPRGIFSWSTDLLIEALGDTSPTDGTGGAPAAGNAVFTLEAVHQRSLSLQQLDRRLRSAFQQQGIELSGDARIEAEGDEWRIVDGAQVYSVRREGNTLNVYTGAEASASGPSSTVAVTDTGSSPGATDDVRHFLNRVYHDLRNFGRTPQERALNHAATNAFQVAQVYVEALHASLALKAIDVERSAMCRQGSDCWDVKLTFFHPQQRMQRAAKVYRFTIDVSDIIPVTVGHTRAWSLYEAV